MTEIAQRFPPARRARKPSSGVHHWPLVADSTERAFAWRTAIKLPARTYASYLIRSAGDNSPSAFFSARRSKGTSLRFLRSARGLRPQCVACFAQRQAKHLRTGSSKRSSVRTSSAVIVDMMISYLKAFEFGVDASPHGYFLSACLASTSFQNSARQPYFCTSRLAPTVSNASRLPPDQSGGPPSGLQRCPALRHDDEARCRSGEGPVPLSIQERCEETDTLVAIDRPEPLERIETSSSLRRGLP